MWKSPQELCRRRRQRAPCVALARIFRSMNRFVTDSRSFFSSGISHAGQPTSSIAPKLTIAVPMHSWSENFGNHPSPPLFSDISHSARRRHLSVKVMPVIGGHAAFNRSMPDGSGRNLEVQGDRKRFCVPVNAMTSYFCRHRRRNSVTRLEIRRT